MKRKAAFTLIELLVVIAIIAILAAIIFPVFMRTKDSAYRNGDLSNMNSIRSALNLYKADQGAFPPAILGYATLYASGPNAGQLMPAGELYGALYPRRIDSIQTLRPAYDRPTDGEKAITNAVWPPADPRPVGTAPIKDLNGDGAVDASDDIAQARQAYGPTSSTPYYCIPSPSNATCSAFATGNTADAAQLYNISGYDVSQVKVQPSGTRNELRYSLRWTSYGVGTGNRDDDPRQLIYNDPPEDTVVTWNTWFVDYNGDNSVQPGRKAIVLFLGGGARPYDSIAMATRSWRVTP
jgi:prepilin-type N-terminal cleavage/methylation domain-containing protein